MAANFQHGDITYHAIKVYLKTAAESQKKFLGIHDIFEYAESR